MKWILVVLIVAATVLGVLWRDALHIVEAVPLVLGCLGSAWLCERRLPAGRSQGASAALFGVAANAVSVCFNIRLLALPYGSSFDSFSTWELRTSFFGLAGVVGIALALRGLVRARKFWKLLAAAGLALSLTHIIVSHRVFLWAIDARALHDLW